MRYSKYKNFLQSKCANCSLSFTSKNVKSRDVKYGSENCPNFDVISYIFRISSCNLKEKLVSYFNNVLRTNPDNSLHLGRETTTSDFPEQPGLVLCRKCAPVITQMYKYHKIFDDLSECDSFLAEIVRSDFNEYFELFDVKSEPGESSDESLEEEVMGLLKCDKDASRPNEVNTVVKSEKANNVVDEENESTKGRITRKMSRFKAKLKNNEVSSSADESANLNDDVQNDNLDYSSDSDYEPEPKKGKKNESNVEEDKGLLTDDVAPLSENAKEKSRASEVKSTKMFGCSICFEEFSTSHRMRWHKLKHFGDAVEVSKHVKGPPYGCPKCDKSYSGLISLQFHAMKKHKLRVPNKLEHISSGWDCDDCLLSFSDAEGLKKHYESSHNKKYFCKYCYAAFEEENILVSHLNEVHRKTNVDMLLYYKPALAKRRSKVKGKAAKSKRPVRGFPCKKCTKVFSTPYKRKVHKLIHVEGVVKSSEIVKGPPFVCPHCNKSYKSFMCFNEHAVIRHKRKHPSPVTSCCCKCDISFSNTEELENHCRSVHGIEYFCKYCNKYFTTSTALQLHEDSHEEKANRYAEADIKVPVESETVDAENVVKSFTCRHCKKVFDTYKLAKTHEQMHKNGEIPQPGCTCKICGKWFKNASDLYSHKYTHTNVKPHMCDKCGLSFKRKNIFIRHAKDHDEIEKGIRPVCPTCGKTFRHSTSLLRHKSRFHTGKKKPECPICHKAFSNPYNIRIHLKICKTAS